MDHTKYSTSKKYTLNKYIYFQEKISVPFSWEYKPGLAKVTHNNNDGRSTNVVLQPPPRSSSRTKRNKHLQVEEIEGPNFVLCAVQPSSLRSKSCRLETERGYPFLETYKKCTKTPKSTFVHKRSSKTNKNNGSWPNITKYVDIFSCKFSGRCYECLLIVMQSC